MYRALSTQQALPLHNGVKLLLPLIQQVIMTLSHWEGRLINRQLEVVRWPSLPLPSGADQSEQIFNYYLVMTNFSNYSFKRKCNQGVFPIISRVYNSVFIHVAQHWVVFISSFYKGDLIFYLFPYPLIIFLRPSCFAPPSLFPSSLPSLPLLHPSFPSFLPSSPSFLPSSFLPSLPSLPLPSLLFPFLRIFFPSSLPSPPFFPYSIFYSLFSYCLPRFISFRPLPAFFPRFHLLFLWCTFRAEYIRWWRKIY